MTSVIFINNLTNTGLSFGTCNGIHNFTGGGGSGRPPTDHF